MGLMLAEMILKGEYEIIRPQLLGLTRGMTFCIEMAKTVEGLKNGECGTENAKAQLLGLTFLY